MRYVVSALVCIGLLFSPAFVYAQSPTVTPGPTPTLRAYSRGELLSGIGVKPYTLIDIPELNMAPRIGGMVTEGGSWFVTLMYLITDSGAAQLIFYLLIMLFVTGFLLGLLHRLMRGQTYQRYHEWRENAAQSWQWRYFKHTPFFQDLGWARQELEQNRRFRHHGGRRRKR